MKIALYVDDTKLYRNVSPVEHCDLIHDTLPDMHEWSLRNNKYLITESEVVTGRSQTEALVY